MDNEDRVIEAIERQTEVLNKLSRPYVIADMFPRHWVNMLYFRIRNVGYSPAYNIQTRIDPPINFRNRISSDLNFFQRPLAVLGPKEEISFFFDSAIDLFNKVEPILQFIINLDYSDSEERTYSEKINIDIDILRNLAIELPTTDNLNDEIEKIRRELEKISRYTESLRNEDIVRHIKASKEKSSQSHIE